MMRGQLRAAALSALNGVGDQKLGQWEVASDIAFHVRRRLTDKEASLVGPVIDIRGTKEAAERVARISKKAPWIPIEVMLKEAGL